MGFRAIANEIRFEITCQLLQDAEVPLCQISGTLGYSRGQRLHPCLPALVGADAIRLSGQRSVALRILVFSCARQHKARTSSEVAECRRSRTKWVFTSAPLKEAVQLVCSRTRADFVREWPARGKIRDAGEGRF